MTIFGFDWFNKATRLFIIPLITIVLLSTSQESQAQSYRFGAINVDGNQRIETATILNYAGIAPGQAIGAGELNEAYQRILASGLFETVDVVPSGGTLLITVQEFPTINQISIEGNDSLKDEDLLSVLQSQTRRVYNPALVEADAEIIALAYQQAGRLAASVRPIIIRRADNRVDLVFEVAEGRVAEVERISFVGNRSYSERRLRRVLESKQAGILRSVIASDTFISDRVEFDKQVLSDFYQSRGYVDFQVLSVNSELSRDRNAVFITFNIREGQKFELGEITASSDLPEIDVDDYQDTIKIKSGQTYSPSAIETTIARLERQAVRQNHDFVRVDPRVTRNDRDLTLDIDFAIVRGPRVFVERIDISGNATTLDRVIRRQFRLVEGDPLNPREIRQSAERIRALNFFSVAEVEAREGSSPDQVVVDVEVEEQPTGSLSFGGSYSVTNGVGFNIAFSERNFLGRGQSIGATLNTTSGNQTSRFSFVEPFVFGRDLSLGLAFEYATTDASNGAFFQSESISFTPSLTFPVSENGRLTLRYRIAEAEVTSVDANSSEILRADQALGALVQSSLGYSYSYDTRRNGLNPDAGLVLRFSQDLSGIGGDIDLLRTTAFLGAETTVFRGDVTLRAVFEGGIAHALSGGTRITERFLLNSSQLRGFDSNGVGPRDLNVPNEDALGGNLFAVIRLESEFPLGLPEEYGIRGGLFFDAGSVWSLDNVNGGPAGADLVNDDFDLRAVFGVSLFWDTPLGPLRFNFSNPIKSQSFDIEQNFDLTISTTF